MKSRVVSCLFLCIVAGVSLVADSRAMVDGLALPATPSATTGFSVYFPVVTRVRGATTTFYTSLDVTNNHSSASTDVNFNYVSADGAISKSGKLVTLQILGNYHADDFLLALADMGVITQTQAESTFGSLFLTFANAAFTTGTEASAVARVYNYVSGASGPSIGLAYRAQLLGTNGAHRLVSLISDTDAPSTAGARLVTNLGLFNVGMNDAGQSVSAPATLTVTFIDPQTGGRVGSQPTYTLNPAQVTQINDVFGQFSIPSTVQSLIVLVEGPTGASAPQIDGYVVLKDVATNDGSYFPMQTASSVTTPPSPPAATVQRLYLSPLLGIKLKSTPTPVTSAAELCLSSVSWDADLGGDISGNTYGFHFGLQTSITSSGSGTMQADIVHKRGSTETVLATTTFTTSTQYAVQNVAVTGVDPNAQNGDTLLVRLKRLSGLPCIAQYSGAGDVNYIDVPPTVIKP